MVLDLVVARGLACNSRTSTAVGSPRSGLTALDLQAMTVQPSSHFAPTNQELSVAQHTILDDDALLGLRSRHPTMQCHQWTLLEVGSPPEPPRCILQSRNFGIYFLIACYWWIRKVFCYGRAGERWIRNIVLKVQGLVIQDVLVLLFHNRFRSDLYSGGCMTPYGLIFAEYNGQVIIEWK